MNRPFNIDRYWTILRHWWLMAIGQSYWHMLQGEGTQFVPGALAGYFNDLRAKGNWHGPTDLNGIPLVRINGALGYFPVTALQKGLGHWDLWLESNRAAEREFTAFQQTASWALHALDNHGGWRTPPMDPLLISEYSAMSQGEGISLLCRAYWATHAEQYLAAATAAAKLMLMSTSAGGTARQEEEGIILEEVPLSTPRTILNGWIFASYGLYDLSLITMENWVQSALASTIATLAAMLSTFDAGYWSFYDSVGNLASPFYHHLHIAQLRVLERTFPQHALAFRHTADRFEMQMSNKTNKLRALVTKGYQKLRHPAPMVID